MEMAALGSDERGRAIVKSCGIDPRQEQSCVAGNGKAGLSRSRSPHPGPFFRSDRGEKGEKRGHAGDEMRRGAGRRDETGKGFEENSGFSG